MILLLTSHSYCDVYYVSSEEMAYCSTNVPCHDLAFYMQKPEVYFIDNTVLYFMNGTHMLYDTLLINGTNNLTLHGLGDIVYGFNKIVKESTVKLTCNSLNIGISVIYTTNIHISGLTIANCGIAVEPVNPVRDTVFPDTVAALGIFETYSVSISNCSLQNNSGIGLLMINAFDTFISYCSFSNNRVQGNTAIYFTNPVNCLTTNESQIYTLNVSDSSFSFGLGTYASRRPADSRRAAGLTIYIEQNCAYQVDVNLVRVIALKNEGDTQGNIGIFVGDTTTYYSLLIDSVYSSESITNAGGGMSIGLGVINENKMCSCLYTPPLQIVSTPVKIINSHFFNNTAVFGAGTFISTSPTKNVNTSQQIIVESSQFNNNSGYAGSGLYITQVEILPFNAPLSFLLTNLTIYGNILINPSISCAMFLFGIELAYIGNIKITYNNDSGLLMYNSLIMFSGLENDISNNQANRGGGISIYGNSILIITEGTTIDIINNHVSEFGGGIYINSRSPFLIICRIQIAGFDDNPIPSEVNFVNNTAQIAGSAIYGGHIDICQSTLQTSPRYISIDLLYKVLNISSQVGLSVVSSDALYICFCSDSRTPPDCNTAFKHFSAYPGDVIDVNIVAVGQRFGITQGIVVISNGFSIQHVVRIPAICSNINHTVTAITNTSNVSIGLIDSNQPQTSLPIDSLTLTVSVLTCPPGFVLSPSKGVCDCSSSLSDVSDIQCVISTNQIGRSGDTWIGYSIQHDCIMVYNECPFDFCSSSFVYFNITRPDPQCALNRSGILCGQCAEGLSLMLGTNKCGECTNDYIALIIPFALAGIALVAFLIALNLTVSVGTINGLIFYANIVKINENIFFPNGTVPFLSQFVSWLNLDLGIQICLFNGMDPYTNTWLQFVFPFYIWGIIFFIIYVCRLSSRISRLVGKNAVPVLATLILLSFTKLISTIVIVFDLAVIHCGSITSYHWSFDANMKYFSVSHGILFLFSLLVLVFIVVPYVLLLLLNPLIGGKISDFRFCRCCVKLKPFFDAYFGPLKDKYRFWIGVLLISRLLLLGISFVNKTATFAITISLTALLITLEASVGGMYKQLYLNVLESFFFFLLLLQATLANNEIQWSGTVVTSIAFLIFTGILIYHIYLQVSEKTNLIQKLKALMIKTTSNNASPSNLEDPLITSNITSVNINAPVTTTVIRRRESLLSSFVSESYQ